VWLTLGFAGMGLLIGNLVGLTSEKVVTPVIGLLFSFIGASILTVLHKLTHADRMAAGKAILALSVSCLVGVYGGVLVSEHHLLTPKDAANATVGDRYLRKGEVVAANGIELQRIQKRLTLEEAYDQMLKLALGQSAHPDGGTQ
jgi:hypothetical protein